MSFSGKLRTSLVCAAFTLPAFSAQHQQPAYTFQEAQTLLKTYCAGCHQGKSAVGGFQWTRLTMETLRDEPRVWTRALSRVRESEMPPKGAPSPDQKQRERFVAWADGSLRTMA